jgi:hypothetical protein
MAYKIRTTHCKVQIFLIIIYRSTYCRFFKSFTKTMIYIKIFKIGIELSNFWTHFNCFSRTTAIQWKGQQLILTITNLINILQEIQIGEMGLHGFAQILISYCTQIQFKSKRTTFIKPGRKILEIILHTCIHIKALIHVKPRSKHSMLTDVNGMWRRKHSMLTDVSGMWRRKHSMLTDVNRM